MRKTHQSFPLDRDIAAGEGGADPKLDILSAGLGHELLLVAGHLVVKGLETFFVRLFRGRRYLVDHPVQAALFDGFVRDTNDDMDGSRDYGGSCLQRPARKNNGNH